MPRALVEPSAIQYLEAGRQLTGCSSTLSFINHYAVRPGERAIVFNRLEGVKGHVYGEGTHLVLPWFEWPIIFDVRTRPRAIKSQTGTRDLQMVDIGLRVLTRPDPLHLPEIYRKIGLDYDDKILPSIVNEVLKQVGAQPRLIVYPVDRRCIS